MCVCGVHVVCVCMWCVPTPCSPLTPSLTHVIRIKLVSFGELRRRQYALTEATAERKGRQPCEDVQVCVCVRALARVLCVLFVCAHMCVCVCLLFVWGMGRQMQSVLQTSECPTLQDAWWHHQAGWTHLHTLHIWNKVLPTSNTHWGRGAGLQLDTPTQTCRLTPAPSPPCHPAECRPR